MATQSYFQERVAFLMTRIILAAVMEGPEGIFTGSFCPVISSLTCVPPTSITRTLRCFAFGCGVFIGVLAGEGSKVYPEAANSQTATSPCRVEVLIATGAEPTKDRKSVV